MLPPAERHLFQSRRYPVATTSPAALFSGIGTDAEKRREALARAGTNSFPPIMKSALQFPIPAAALDVRIAAARRELTDAFELVYRAYVEKRYIQPNPGRIVYRAAFGLPSSRTIIAATAADEVVGTLTVVGDNPLGLQLESTFPSEVQSARDGRRNLAEVTCLAIEPEGDLPPRGIFFALTRFMIQYAYWRHYDYLLLAIHPRHERFYRRCFGVAPLGPCRPHGVVNGNPAVCCRIDLHNLRCDADPQLWRQYFAQALPNARYLCPPIKPEDHQHFCHRSGILPDADSPDRVALSKDAA